MQMTADDSWEMTTLLDTLSNKKNSGASIFISVFDNFDSVNSLKAFNKPTKNQTND